MGFHKKNRKSIFQYILIASLVLHYVTSQDLEDSDSQLGEVENNDEAQPEAPLIEQQGNKGLNVESQIDNIIKKRFIHILFLVLHFTWFCI